MNIGGPLTMYIYIILIPEAIVSLLCTRRRLSVDALLDDFVEYSVRGVREVLHDHRY